MKYLQLYENYNKSIFKNIETGTLIDDVDNIDDDSGPIKTFHIIRNIRGYGTCDAIYNIYKTNDGDFVLVNYDDEVVNYEDAIEYWKNFDNRKIAKLYLDTLEKIDKEFLVKFTYDYQKKLLIEHPEKIGELKDIGFHEEIKKEFPALVRGSKWGFFDLKESINTEELLQKNYNKLDWDHDTYDENIDDEKEKMLNFIRLLIKSKGEKGELRIDDYVDGYYIESVDEDSVIGEDIDLNIDSEMSNYCLDTYPNLESLYEYLKKKYPKLATGQEWGFFDLERSEQ